MNQRPIGRIPNDPDDGTYLCPNDMLLGRATLEVPQGPFKDTNNPQTRVEFVPGIVDSFWKRWSRDVFPSLVSRKKWHVENRYVQVDDVVTLIVMPSEASGLSAEYSREYNRPVTKIAVIYPVEGYD